MGLHWREEQKLAIDYKHKNMLISAGAGSGKTAVLTQRVVENMKKGISIENMLILTFTRAAAAEMKKRILDKIKKEPSLYEELFKIDSAYITTFDSFSLFLVKKYHYKLGISKNISPCPSHLINLYKKEILRNILDEYYQKEDKNIKSFALKYLGKDDKTLISSILKIDRQLDLLIDKEKYLKNYDKNFINEKTIEKAIKDFKSKIDLIKKEIKEIFDSILRDNIMIDKKDEEVFEKFKKEYGLFMISSSIEDLNYAIKNIKVTMNQAKNANDELKDKLNKLSPLKSKINDLIKNFTSYDQIRAFFRKNFIYEKLIIDILTKFNKKVMFLKREKELFEFNDIAKMAINLIETNRHIKDELKNKFGEILLDEYQDTSDIQEKLISLISKDNLCMVGDIKQSIYGFRNANPFIFSNKHSKYKKSVDNKLIEFNFNYRSRDEVIDNINTIFSPIMSETYGAANYEKGHKIFAANLVYEKMKNKKQEYNMDIINYDFKGANKVEKFTLEALYILKDIEERINKKEKVVDENKDGKPILREITYSDFTILSENRTYFNVFSDVFSKFNVPLAIYKDSDIRDESEIIVLKNLFLLLNKYSKKELDNEFKKAFLSVGRSFLYGLSDKQVFKYIKEEKYYNNKIYEDLKHILEKIEILTLSQIFHLLIKKSDFYYKLTFIGNSKMRIKRIDFLYDDICVLEKNGYRVKDINKYFENLYDSEELKMKETIETSEAVKLMTIHNSKGLEYNNCYFVGLHNEFSDPELKELIYFEKDLGLIFNFYNNTHLIENIKKVVLKDNNYRLQASEKMRLFYVALTRTKEKIIILAPLKNKYKIHETKEAKSFDDFLSLNIQNLKKYIKYIEKKYYDLATHFEPIKKTHKDKLKNIKEDKNYTPKIKQIKQSQKEIKEKTFSKKGVYIENNKTIEYGNKIHEILKYSDFSNLQIKEEKIKKIVQSFLKSPLMTGYKEARIIKEHEFYYNEENTILHGYIDLILVFNDHIKVIDYKLKEIDKKEYEKQILGYTKYLENHFKNKKIEAYLYSLLEEKYKKIK